MSKSFAPKIRTPDGDITPKGYEWILGFALAGCAWAIKEADTPEFRKSMIDDLKKQKRNNIERVVSHYENEIKQLRQELKDI